MANLPLVKTSYLNCTIQIAQEHTLDFVDWQANLHHSLAMTEGFLSLEIVAVPPLNHRIWKMALRFASEEHCVLWQQSSQAKSLFEELQFFLNQEVAVHLVDANSSKDALADSKVSELFVVALQPNKEAEFRQWIAKIHHVEATFPGFLGVYVQAPISVDHTSKHWITFLQFDSQKHLDTWLSSSERQLLIQQSKSMIASLENHRVISSYPGWFGAFAGSVVNVPPLWKQAMLVLLMLFPIVMLEKRFLSPWIAELNPAVGMFIGNVISVAVLTWPFMPYTIRAMHWWLSPEVGSRAIWKSAFGAILICAIYILSIWFFSEP